jgi:DNA (cytosine-5)-methyltransferase 1
VTRLVGFPRLADGQDSVIIDGTAYRARDFRREDEPSFTVTSKARSWTIFAGHLRTALTPAQGGCLQAFRADYPWKGSRTAKFEQLGNAVPPPISAVLIGFVSN